ncbi:MAG: RNA-binding S4 domain-containing protein [Bacteroidales bacterium]|nr:RNA-binding S4 domain-containing protein [Bacteroidales bacterium]
MDDGIRIDKWLWAVRIFKTRNQTGEACKAGKVRINDKPVKPSREIKLDDVITIQRGQLNKTVKVIGLLKNRVGAKLVANYLLDLTPQEEYDKLKLAKEMNYEYRHRGLGRPTKKERRIIDRIKKHN